MCNSLNIVSYVSRGGTIELPIFIACSALITYLSRNGLRERHSYGYYRFFLLEFILLLIVANLHAWFNDPLSPPQVLSWVSLLVSVYLAISGFRLLGLKGATGTEESDELVESGIYRRIRHPLYSSLLFLALGVYLKKPSLFSSILILGSVFTLMATVVAEEKLNEEKFGSRYVDYKRRTKAFIPYIF